MEDQIHMIWSYTHRNMQDCRHSREHIQAELDQDPLSSNIPIISVKSFRPTSTIWDNRHLTTTFVTPSGEKVIRNSDILEQDCIQSNKRKVLDPSTSIIAGKEQHRKTAHEEQQDKKHTATRQRHQPPTRSSHSRKSSRLSSRKITTFYPCQSSPVLTNDAPIVISPTHHLLDRGPTHSSYYTRLNSYRRTILHR